ncbi:hypothetical protein F4604DRAFT_1680422 [Suillus subluteus]|nr:hypothetical protein F4604DRAFT_1680422 [Suillus subluteus]
MSYSGFLCPNCAKYFNSDIQVQRHLRQPNTACLQRVNSLVNTKSLLEYYPPVLSKWQRVRYPSLPSVEDNACEPFEAPTRPTYSSAVESYEGAAQVVDTMGTTFMNVFDQDQFSSICKEKNLHYPFADRKDWQVAEFLLMSSLSMAEIDQFLSLDLVNIFNISNRYIANYNKIKGLPLSFQSATELRGQAKLPPEAPQWHCKTIDTTYPTKSPVRLFWRNPLDCLKALFSNPLFSESIELTLQQIYKTAEHLVRVYGEWISGDLAWRMQLFQSNIPDGATLLGTILSSDKTHITNISGGKAAHPLLISLVNICMNVHNKASSNAFLLTALLPIPDFIHPVKSFVIEPLKIAAHIGIMMSDPALHHWYHQFYDHDVRWCTQAVGKQEIDYCFSILQPITGYRHFKQGITTLKQVTGRTQRDLQCYMVAVITGAAPSGLIPKLELLQSILPSIQKVGAVVQWSADTTERAHIDLIKDPSSASNNKDYKAQICYYLDRAEKCCSFSLATSIREKEYGRATIMDALEEDEVTEELEREEDDPELPFEQWRSSRPMTDYYSISLHQESGVGPQPCCTFIAGPTAFHLNYNPSVGSTFEGLWLTIYFKLKLAILFKLKIKEDQVWYKVHIQQRAYHDGTTLLSAQTLNIHPPKRGWAQDCYDAVIVNVDDKFVWPKSGLKGHIVCELHLIFHLIPPHNIVPWWAKQFLVYAQCLDPISPSDGTSTVDPITRMVTLKCATRTSGIAMGDIIPLNQIRSLAHIVPWFGALADPHLTSSNSSHYSTIFYLNSYIDKEFYYALHSSGI